MKYVHTSVSKIGLQRLDNEDAVGVFECPNGLLVVVCDGLGGNKAGEVASQLTVNIVFNTFNESDESDYLVRIKNSIIKANRSVLEQSSVNKDLSGMATTVEVLFLTDDTAYWGHVGDSRIYNSKNGKLKQLTKDHSLVQKLLDEGYLTVKEAENHPNKNIIMRALGDSASLDIDLSKQKLNNKDDHKFFVCTDGVTSVITDNELEEFLKLDNIESVSQNLSQLIEERGAPDNYTFAFVKKKK